jgi:hypothetical protein
LSSNFVAIRGKKNGQTLAVLFLVGFLKIKNELKG